MAGDSPARRFGGRSNLLLPYSPWGNRQNKNGGIAPRRPGRGSAPAPRRKVLFSLKGARILVPRSLQKSEAQGAPDQVRCLRELSPATINDGFRVPARFFNWAKDGAKGYDKEIWDWTFDKIAIVG